MKLIQSFTFSSIPTESFSFFYFTHQKSFPSPWKLSYSINFSLPCSSAPLIFILEQHPDIGISRVFKLLPVTFFWCKLLEIHRANASFRNTQSKRIQITSKTRRHLTSNGISQVRVWNSYQIAIIVFLLPVISSNRLNFHLLKRKKIKHEKCLKLAFSWNKLAKYIISSREDL